MLKMHFIVLIEPISMAVNLKLNLQKEIGNRLDKCEEKIEFPGDHLTQDMTEDVIDLEAVAQDKDTTDLTHQVHQEEVQGGLILAVR